MFGRLCSGNKSTAMEINELTRTVIEICIKIHSTVGPGCFEKVYEEILYYELIQRGIEVERQVCMPITYESLFIPHAYKMDLLIEKQLVVELKSVEFVLPVHFRQVTTYLNLMKLKNGMIINFKVHKMKEGIHRVFNNFGNLTLREQKEN